LSFKHNKEEFEPNQEVGLTQNAKEEVGDAEGKERIFETRWDLIEEGIFPEDSDLSLEEMKEALDSPCMIGQPTNQLSVKLVKLQIM